MQTENPRDRKGYAQNSGRFYGTSDADGPVLKCIDCGQTLSAEDAEDHVCPANRESRTGDGTYHVVCHDCPFEEIVDDTNAPTGSPQRDAGTAWHDHREETGHDVDWDRVDDRSRRVATDGGVNFHRDLTAFQQDILFCLRRIERGEADESQPYGLGIKRELEALREVDVVNHGRLYPNLDELVEIGLIEKSMVDRRTNEYETTRAGRDAIEQHATFVLESVAERLPATDGGVDQ